MVMVKGHGFVPNSSGSPGATISINSNGITSTLGGAALAEATDSAATMQAAATARQRARITVETPSCCVQPRPHYSRGAAVPAESAGDRRLPPLEPCPRPATVIAARIRRTPKHASVGIIDRNDTVASRRPSARRAAVAATVL